MRLDRGLSLIETVIAIFVLLTVFVIFASLFEWLLASTRKAEKGATASRLASNRLAELRAWAAQPNGSSDNFHAGDWAALAQPVEAEAGFLVSVERVAAALLSPCSGLESPFGNPRQVSAACLRVRIHVANGLWSYDQYSQLTAPPVVGKLVQVSGATGSTLSPGDSITLTAQAIDTLDQPIDDLVYHWTVLPMTGSGTITLLDRNGRSASFQNNDPHTKNGSQLRVEVNATYRGVVLKGQSGIVREDGP